MKGAIPGIKSPQKAKTGVELSSGLNISIKLKDMNQQPITKVVDRLLFQMMTPGDIRKMSVARVITPDLHDEEGLPLSGGLLDPRFGPTAPGERCATCGQHASECLGHFGHIELARPVVRPDFRHDLLFALQLTCWHCHRFLLTVVSDPEHPRRVREFLQLGKESRDEFRRGDGPCDTLQGAARQLVLEGGTNDALIRRRLWKMYKGEMGIDQQDCGKKPGELEDSHDNKEGPDPTCPHCGAKHPKVRFEGPMAFYAEGMGKGTRWLPPAEILDHLAKIPDDDCWCLGINPGAARPEQMLIQVLPVPPTCVRPSVTLEDGTRSEDDLTHKLVDIVRVNQYLQENLDAGAPPLLIDDLSELLQYHVTSYFNNQQVGIVPSRHRSGQVLKTWAQRLEGKEGRIRHTLSGKRVNSCARTVISPAPHLGINQLGVPRQIAMTLTVPERVTAWNIEAMKQLVINGPRKHPGANYLVRADGRRIALHVVKHRHAIIARLLPGFVVERHLQDGDIVLFNRQPSLHRMSIMAHEAVVMPGKTFRVPIPACTPYNADFDGDEMNLHVPQSEGVRAEAAYLLRVQEHFISPRSGVPVMGCIQDHVSMAYLLTRHGAYFTRAQTCQLLYHGNVFQRDPAFQLGQDLKPRQTVPQELYWGKDIFSVLLPTGVYLAGQSKFCLKCKPCLEQDCPFDAYVVVRDGQLLRGVIDKATLGALQPKSLLGKIVREHGSECGRQFLDDVSQMMLAMLPLVGLTMGLDEVAVNGDILYQIAGLLEEAGKEAKEYIQAYYQKDERVLQPTPGMTLRETLEVRLANLLANARNKAGEIATDSLGNHAHSVIMTKSRARGDPLNLAQMAACVGQQSVRGARIHRGYRDRTLPHFRVGDLSPAARGFVTSSYRQGLTPVEFFFHAMGGREGLVDTAARTSSSGYLQRRLVNAMQDLVVAQDLTVRDARGNIVQFQYGDDGIDPAKSDHGYPVNLDDLLMKVMAFTGEGEQECDEGENLPSPHPPAMLQDTIIQGNPAHVSLVTKLVAHALVEKNLPRVISRDSMTDDLRQAILGTGPDLSNPILKDIARSRQWKPYTLRMKVMRKMKALRSLASTVDLSRVIPLV